MMFVRVGNGTRIIAPQHIVSLEIFENTKTVFAKGTTEVDKGKKKINIASLTVREPYSIRIKTTNGTEYINCDSKKEAVETYANILKVINPKTDIDKVIMEVNKLYVKKENRIQKTKI